MKETIYSLPPFQFTIWRDTKGWILADTCFMFHAPFKLLDGTKAGGHFKTLKEAEAELVRVIKYIHVPLTEEEIMNHFDDKWITKEEQTKELFQFRNAIRNGCWKEAAEIYNKKFSNFTREAIPDKVYFQVCINLDDKDAL